MSDKPVHPVKQLIPGLIVDATNTVHFFPNDFLRWRGLPLTPENQEMAMEAAKRAARKAFPTTTIVQVFDKGSYQP